MQGEVFDVDRIEESLEQIFTQALMEPTKALWLGPKLSGVLLQRQRDDLQSIQADAHFKYKGLSFFGEYANRVATDGGPINELNEIYHTGSALNLQTGYLFKNNWELAGRYTQVNFEDETGLDNFTQYTVGFSKYIVGHNLKIQGDFGITQEANNNDILFIRLQTEFNF